MNPEDVTAVLEKIAEALAPTAQAVWAIYLRQVYVDAAINLFWGVLCAGGVAILTTKMLTWWKRSKPDYGYGRDSDDYGWVFAGAILGAMLALIAIICLNAAINGLANPEYHAIDMLLYSVRGAGQ
jgi:hypothetical protein